MRKTRLAVLLFCSLISIGLSAQYEMITITEPAANQCNGELEIIVPSAVSNYSFTWSNGKYTQRISNLCAGVYSVIVVDSAGCSFELSTIIGVASSCTLVVEDLKEVITPSCPSQGIGSIVFGISLPENYTFEWDNGLEGHKLENLLPGEYCVTVTDKLSTNTCFVSTCFTVSEMSGCSGATKNRLIVNEFSVSSNVNYQFIELLVIDDGSCTPADLRGYIVDDNNGDYTHPSYGNYSLTGVSNGHIRFKNIQKWASVPIGSIIVLYKGAGARPFKLAAADDPDDQDGDLVYIIPIEDSECFEGNSSYPSLTAPFLYPEQILYGDPAWSYIALRSNRDAVQVRNPDGTYCHAVIYGGSNYMTGGPDDMTVATSGNYRYFSFMGSDPRNKLNYTVTVISTQLNSEESPGRTNSEANYEFRKLLHCTPPISNEQIDSTIVFINELSNGATPGEEYVELIAYNLDCSSVDLRGYILDDNNGLFNKTNVVSNTGISQGHIRFTNDEAWSKLKSPTLILIYNPMHKSPTITYPDDPYDTNDDRVIILPSSHPLLGGVNTYPSLTNLEEYGVVRPTYEDISDWNTVFLFDKADAIQIRNPKGEYVHGISYGGGDKISGGPDSLHLSDMAATDVVFTFQKVDYRQAENYVVANGDGINNRTPGEPNNQENKNFLISLCFERDKILSTFSTELGDANLEEVADLVAKAYPNPFRNKLVLEFQNAALYMRKIEVVITQVTGNVVYSKEFDTFSGINKFNIPFAKEQFRSGVYFLTIKEGGKTIQTEKIIKL